MVTIDRATAEGVEEISTLIGEIEEYYGGTNTPGDPDRIRTMLFGPQPVATVLLARDGASVLGKASYTYPWPAAGTEASLYLKELFVRKAARRRGVAKLFMDRLRDIAAEAGCSRVEWTADADNPAALAFHQGFKAWGSSPPPTSRSIGPRSARACFDPGFTTGL